MQQPQQASFAQQGQHVAVPPVPNAPQPLSDDKLQEKGMLLCPLLAPQ
jgi:hypothetical protein